jgi:hypothetical protein
VKGKICFYILCNFRQPCSYILPNIYNCVVVMPCAMHAFILYLNHHCLIHTKTTFYHETTVLYRTYYSIVNAHARLQSWAQQHPILYFLKFSAHLSCTIYMLRNIYIFHLKIDKHALLAISEFKLKHLVLCLWDVKACCTCALFTL